MRKIPGELVSAAKNATKYDYAKLFDGSQWELKRGVDFAPEIHNFRSFLHTKAKRHGKLVSIATVNSDTIRIQARDAK